MTTQYPNPAEPDRDCDDRVVEDVRDGDRGNESVKDASRRSDTQHRPRKADKSSIRAVFGRSHIQMSSTYRYSYPRVSAAVWLCDAEAEGVPTRIGRNRAS